jgi:CheY-like chemotaxis protein
VKLLDNVKTILARNNAALPQVEQKSDRKKVLIVEDEQALADALELDLKDVGYDVKKAGNGQIGLDFAKTYQPDIIILDLLMPIMDGKTMLHHLRQIPQFKDLPVIVLTNAGDVANIRETLVYHDAASFLVKSNVSTEEIVKTVKSIL